MLPVKTAVCRDSTLTPLEASIWVTSCTIPADIRPQLEKSARDIGEKFLDRIARLNAEALTVMQEHGLQINRVSDEGAAYWRKEFHEKGGDAFIDKRYSREFYDDVQRELEKYRAGTSP